MKKKQKRDSLICASIRVGAGDWAQFGKVAENRSEVIRRFIKEFISGYGKQGNTTLGKSQN